MSKPKSKSFTSIVVQSLGWPLFWGLSATAGFYLLVGWGVVQSQLVSRYFAGHPVEYVETALFFVGVMALALKALDLTMQFRSIPAIKLPEAGPRGDAPTRSTELLDVLAGLSRPVRETYLVKRLTRALQYVERCQSAGDIDDQLRHLSDVDAERSHDGYSLVRIIVWATPMLGFLGTVIGITLALGDLSPEALVNAPKEAMQGLLAGLSVAFDTTALALSLSIVLMFMQFVVREVETQLLSIVDSRAEDELVGRFQIAGSSSDPNVGAVKEMSTQVLGSLEQLNHRQAEIWGTVIATTQREWRDALQRTSKAVESSLESALGASVAAHAETILEAEQRASEKSESRWERFHEEMRGHATALVAQSEAAAQQNEVMLKVLEATGEVRSLESALNQNLSALAGAKNFEDTVMSLSAAIQLLTSRIGVTRKDLDLTNDGRGRAA